MAQIKKGFYTLCK